MFLLLDTGESNYTKYLYKIERALSKVPIDYKIAGIDNITVSRDSENSLLFFLESLVDIPEGELEMLIITSRDPEPPGLDYLNAAGGFFRDTTIHDFDLARFILGDDPIIQVSAFGSQLISEDVKKVNDHDTAMFILKSKSGVLIHINNSSL